MTYSVGFCLLCLYVLMYSRIVPRSFSLGRTNYCLYRHQSFRLQQQRLNSDLFRPQEEAESVPNSPDTIDRLKTFALHHPDQTKDVNIFRSLFKFPLDDFQVSGFQSLLDDKNVIVTTPTGSGKTLIAELAIYYALMMDTRVIYTTPLKALSNQKFSDFQKKFGKDRVGLVTGDISINSDAPVVVMTTEVFRNSLYGSYRGPRLAKLFAVCFDEFHYMNDPERGTVWEECIIGCPPDTRILALSATMGNVNEVQRWFSSVHGPTDLVTSTYRPVPLRYYHASKKGLLPFFADPHSGPGAVNGIVRDAFGNLDPKCLVNPAIVGKERRDPEHDRQSGGKSSRRGHKKSKNSRHMRHRALEHAWKEMSLAERATSFEKVVDLLHREDKLPAILFVFSRARCTSAAKDVLKSGVILLTPEERTYVANALITFMKANPMIPIAQDTVKCLLAGVGVHHAGLLPVWRRLIEQLFLENKIKVLFATETLAAGINMPARTTVLPQLTKYIARTAIPLKTSEMLQMAGRAGRRGHDVEGSVVIMQNDEEDPSFGHRILVSRIDGIKSRFRASYGLTVKLLQRNTLSQSQSMLERVFGAFGWRQRVSKRNAKGGGVTVETHRAMLAKYGWSTASEYFRLVRLYDNDGGAGAGSGDEQAAASTATTISAKSTASSSSSSSSQAEEWKQTIDRHPITINGDAAAVLDAMTFLLASNITDPIAFVAGGSSSSSSSSSNSSNDGSSGSSNGTSASSSKSVAWKMFHRVTDILDDFYAIYRRNDEEVVVLPLGETIANTTGENELWLALLLQHPVIAGPGHATALMEETRRLIAAEEQRHLETPSLVTSFAIAPRDVNDPEYIADQAHALQQKVLGYEALRFNVFHATQNRSYPREGIDDTWYDEDDLPPGFDVENDYDHDEDEDHDEDSDGDSDNDEFDGDEDDVYDDDDGSNGSDDDKQRAVGFSGPNGHVLSPPDGTWEITDPYDFACIIAATLYEESRWEKKEFRAPPPENVLRFASTIRPMVLRLMSQQNRSLSPDNDMVMDFPAMFSTSVTGLVYCWASGRFTWRELCQLTTLDQGDLCRLLRRTVDVLRQIPDIPNVSDKVLLMSWKAVDAMDRFPVSDDGMMSDDTMTASRAAMETKLSQRLGLDTSSTKELHAIGQQWNATRPSDSYSFRWHKKFRTAKGHMKEATVDSLRKYRNDDEVDDQRNEKKGKGKKKIKRRPHRHH